MMKGVARNTNFSNSKHFLIVSASLLAFLFFIQPSLGKGTLHTGSIPLTGLYLNFSPGDTLTSNSDYIQALIEWTLKHEEGKSIDIKISETRSDSILAKIQFHSYNIKALSDLFHPKSLDGIKGTISGTLTIARGISTFKIAGNIKVLEGFAKLSNFGKQSLENIVIDTTTSLSYEINRFDSLRLNINLSFDEGFYIRNKRFLPMKVGVRGKLHLMKKAGSNVQITGTLQAVEGFTEPLGKHFDLVKGSFTYVGPAGNPQIYLKSLYQPHRAEQDIKIWYTIEGTIENPAFKFESDPPMRLKSIIAYTLFGRPYYLLDSVEQSLVSSVVTNSAADYTAEVLLNRAEAIATQKLGVDVVRIDNTTSESGTVITTGWYINPKVFFAIQNVIAGNPHIGFYLEYYLKEDLKLILSQDSNYGQGIDLQWEYDY